MALENSLNNDEVSTTGVVEWYFRELADTAGRMAKACESLDHTEAVPPSFGYVVPRWFQRASRVSGWRTRASSRSTHVLRSLGPSPPSRLAPETQCRARALAEPLSWSAWASREGQRCCWARPKTRDFGYVRSKRPLAGFLQRFLRSISHDFVGIARREILKEADNLGLIQFS